MKDIQVWIITKNVLKSVEDVQKNVKEWLVLYNPRKSVKFFYFCNKKHLIFFINFSNYKLHILFNELSL